MRAFSYRFIFSYILILLGIYLLGAAIYDEYRGITTKPVSLVSGVGFHRRGMGHAYLYRIHVRRERDAELFRQYMTGHWTWVIGIEVVGWIFYVKTKQSEDVT
jgi:hypothetical protein